MERWKKIPYFALKLAVKKKQKQTPNTFETDLKGLLFCPGDPLT